MLSEPSSPAFADRKSIATVAPSLEGGTAYDERAVSSFPREPVVICEDVKSVESCLINARFLV